ncbi:MAG: hypothetical protein H7Y00_11670 [Fimbriimonadaceae bacterium]|nr:hypothetical protein [Chitinophagales bacterium]
MQNPSYQIINFYIENLHENSEDVVTFNCEIFCPDLSKQTIPFFTTYNVLKKSLQDDVPDFFELWQKTRTDIGGWGPKELKVAERLLIEEVDFEAIIKIYIDKAISFKEQFEWWEKLRSMQPEQQVDLQNANEKLDSSFHNSIQTDKRSERLAEKTEKFLSELILEEYPEIFNSESHFITDLRGELVNIIINLQERIDHLANKAKQKM